MEHLVKLDSVKNKNSDASNWNEEIVVKQENIELEIDPLSLYDEGIETDNESEEKFQCIDYSHWYKSSVVDLSRSLCLPLEQENDVSFFNLNHSGDLTQKSFVCFYCGELWNDRYGLKFHIKDIHMAEQSIKSTIKAFECFYCKRKFKNIQRLVAHTKRKHKQNYKEKKKREKNSIEEGKPFACQFCKYKARARCLVNYHIKRVHEKIKPYPCPYCDFRSAYSNRIAHHIESKHIKSKGKRVKPSVYDIYSKRSIQSQKVIRQTMLKHKDLKPYACPKCDYTANRENILNNHIKTKHDRVTYYCPYCDFRTINSKDMKIHIQKKHEQENPFRCSHSNFQFSRSNDLKFHDKRKKYSCPYCNYNCFKVSDLKSHTSLVHGTVSTLYSCAHCDFLSYNLEELKSHATALHGKVELFSCPHCEFRCVQKEKLDFHKYLRHKNI